MVHRALNWPSAHMGFMVTVTSLFPASLSKRSLAFFRIRDFVSHSHTNSGISGILCILIRLPKKSGILICFQDSRNGLFSQGPEAIFLSLTRHGGESCGPRSAARRPNPGSPLRVSLEKLCGDLLFLPRTSILVLLWVLSGKEVCSPFL